MDPQTATGAAAELPALSGATLCHAFQATVQAFRERPALRTRDGSIEWTWGDYAARTRRIAGGLAGLGITRGDTVALMLTNRPHFNVTDCSAMHLGAIPWSIYNTSTPEQIKHMLVNAGSRVIVTERQFLDRISAVRDGTELEHVVCVDAGGSDMLTLDELERMATASFDFEEAWQRVEPDDLLTLVYTSGTTGPAKGVELTHGSVLAMLHGMFEMVNPSPQGRCLSYLPAAHLADRCYAHYWAMFWGTTVTCLPDASTMPAVMKEVRPTLWGSVPRVWEKLRAALESEFGDDQRSAVEIGRRVVRAGQAGEPIDDELRQEHAAVEETLAAIRAQIGLDQAEWLVIGAAPCSRDMLEFYAALGLAPSEVYGMTELSGNVTLNPPRKLRLGTVGRVLPGCEVVLAADGELLARGPILMKGYRGQPELTREAVDAEGWLHTGDIGEIDGDGYVKIIDRKKELIINAGGKNMSPIAIEAALISAGPLIGQAMAFGDRRPYNVALLVLDRDGGAQWARANDREYASLQAMADDEEVHAAVQAEVNRANEGLSRIEQIKRWTLLFTEWVPAGDELTPTMKLKRKAIAEKYAGEIQALYQS